MKTWLHGSQARGSVGEVLNSAATSPSGDVAGRAVKTGTLPDSIEIIVLGRRCVCKFSQATNTAFGVVYEVFVADDVCIVPVV